jgi:hypothetical protein
MKPVKGSAVDANSHLGRQMNSGVNSPLNATRKVPISRVSRRQVCSC